MKLKLVVLWISSFVIFSECLFCQSDGIDDLTQFNIVFSEETFAHVNEMDAKASLNIYVNKYRRGWEIESGNKIKTDIIILNEKKSIESINQSGVASVFQISSIEYLMNKQYFDSEPFAVGLTGEKPLETYILLVNKNGKIKSLRDLKGKKIITIGGMVGSLIKLWLDVKFLEEFSKDADDCLSEILFVEDASKAILNLFFNKYDACVLNENSFSIMKEMNPKLKNDVVELTRSEELLPGLSVLENSQNEHFNNFVKDYALNMAKEKHSKQMLLLFRIKNVIPFKNEYLKNIKLLLTRKNKLESRTKN